MLPSSILYDFPKLIHQRKGFDILREIVYSLKKA
jgi:hypothetical protein